MCPNCREFEVFIAVMFLIKWSEPKGKSKVWNGYSRKKNAINGLYEEMFVDVMWLIFRGKMSKLKLCRRFECGKCFVLFFFGSLAVVRRGWTRKQPNWLVKSISAIIERFPIHNFLMIFFVCHAELMLTSFFFRLFCFSYKNCGRVVRHIFWFTWKR